MSSYPEQLYQHRLSRRAILRGLGASVALPILPSFVSRSARAAEALAGASNEPPRRWMAMIFANGVNTDHWWQKTDASISKDSGAVTELGRSLEPLQPYVQDCLFLNQLRLFDQTTNFHTQSFTNFLAGVEVKPGSVPNLGQSLDQFMARTVGNSTQLPSLTLGLEPAGLGSSGKHPSIYHSTISWRSSTSPVSPEIFPRQAFDRLFDTKTLVRDQSVLDLVMEDAKSLKSGLTVHDRDRLDQYMESIRSIEKRIEIATREDRLEGWQPSLQEPNLPRPAEGTPQNVPEHMKLMMDIIILAFQMDKTRIATLLFQRDLSNMLFTFLNGVGNTGLHDLSHHRGQSDALQEYAITNHFHAQQLAYLMERMKRIDEGNGTTLLDNTAILFGSPLADGNGHDANHLRLIVAGGRSMGIRGGRAITYARDADRRICNLHLDLAQRMGCRIENFSNSHYPIPHIGEAA